MRTPAENAQRLGQPSPVPRAVYGKKAPGHRSAGIEGVSVIRDLNGRFLEL